MEWRWLIAWCRECLRVGREVEAGRHDEVAPEIASFPSSTETIRRDFAGSAGSTTPRDGSPDRTPTPASDTTKGKGSAIQDKRSRVSFASQTANSVVRGQGNKEVTRLTYMWPSAAFGLVTPRHHSNTIELLFHTHGDSQTIKGCTFQSRCSSAPQRPYHHCTILTPARRRHVGLQLLDRAAAGRPGNRNSRAVFTQPPRVLEGEDLLRYPPRELPAHRV